MGVSYLCGVDMVKNLSMRLSLRFTLEVIAEQRAIRVKGEALGGLGHEDDGMRMTSWINCEFSCVDHVVILPSNIIYNDPTPPAQTPPKPFPPMMHYARTVINNAVVTLTTSIMSYQIR